MASCGNTILKNLGQHYPRMMRLELAAAYSGLNVGPWREIYGRLIVKIRGTEMVDKHELDAAIDAEKQKAREESK